MNAVSGAMRILILIDGIHTEEVFASLGRLLPLRESELVLAYVRGPGPRAGLDLLRGRPVGPRGGHPLPPHRLRDVAEAEQQGAASALAEAKSIAQSLAKTVTAHEMVGEPGQQVCQLAARVGAELVVVRAGGRDQPQVGPRSLGPAARFIADHCQCSVLLLRAIP